MTDEPEGRVLVGGVEVRGVDVDEGTRCAHYGTDRDVVAAAFPCCGTFFPCHRCHAAVADHDDHRWPRSSFDERAVLCGACVETLAVETYLDSPLACPACETAFNPDCRDHHDRYFDV